MKQHITSDQLQELSDKGKEKLLKWWEPDMGDMYYDDGNIDIIYCCEEEIGGKERKGYENVLPLLSIGQMIEYLEEQSKNDDDEHDYIITPYKSKSSMVCLKWWDISDEPIELCDALWSAVKEDLEA